MSAWRQLCGKWRRAVATYLVGRRGRQGDIVKLYGSMELGPILGLSDLIVDLVDTGETLRTNGLAEIEEIAGISARLIANRASMRIKGTAMRAVADRFAAAARTE